MQEELPMEASFANAQFVMRSLPSKGNEPIATDFLAEFTVLK